jgi:tRNA(Arg) A34 adenosine deaminase TadA
MKNLESFMNIAIEEAKTSLKEGNSGFGAVIIKDSDLILKVEVLSDIKNGIHTQIQGGSVLDFGNSG